MTRTPVVMPSSEEGQIRELHRVLQLGSSALIGADGEKIELPPSIHELLKNILRDMQAGLAVSLVPEKQQLTTQRAAQILGISRPFLIKLLDAGDIPYHRTGSHRRVYLQDLLVYKKRRDEARHLALNELAREAYAAGLYHDTGIPEGGNDE